ATVFEIFLGQPFIDRLRQFFVADECRMRIEQIERARVANCHERQLLTLGKREDTNVERIEAWRVDGAQLARSRAGRRFQLKQIKPEPASDAMGCDIELGAGAARRTAGVVCKFHRGTSRSSRRRAGAAAAVFVTNNVRSGLILPRKSMRMMRGSLTRARSPCTLSTSAPGSTRPRSATILRSVRECRARSGNSIAAFAFSGSMTRLTIGIAAGQTSSHL